MLGTDVQPGDETQVSYQSSTATLGCWREKDGLDQVNGGDLCVDDEPTPKRR